MNRAELEAALRALEARFAETIGDDDGALLERFGRDAMALVAAASPEDMAEIGRCLRQLMGGPAPPATPPPAPPPSAATGAAPDPQA
ncbi:hypothetical protein ACFOED_09325 [Vulcaniibacterium thermophilum]|uniref:Uncharacterized protein n=1 Tax=Vulcaniibacterium thermophilum TaxID=1169913 RepID=A0A918Z740_9GAMM|nr:hypothetical protein [Vulcaniibacterium thermophilum]GHE38776.1 hypothetical protein GCM10007167_21080 [Vulcaniibacterium thermophilum]